LTEGKVAARDEFGPRGEAVRIDAAVWQAPDDAERKWSSAGLVDDGIIQVECTLRDARGQVSHNDLVVAAEIEGGKLLFLENGDLSDNTSHVARERKTFEGQLIAFVRAAGPATLRLRAPGLPVLEIRL
jgi:beta-galactosidase